MQTPQKNSKEHCNVVVIDKIIIVKGKKKENLDGWQEKKCEIIQQILPQKEAHYDVVMLPISIGDMEVGSAFLNMDTRVNIISL